MSVNSYLQTLASSLVLSDTEKSSIKTLIEALKRNLSYCSDRDDIKETLIFGSFTRLMELFEECTKNKKQVKNETETGKFEKSSQLQ